MPIWRAKRERGAGIGHGRFPGAALGGVVPVIKDLRANDPATVGPYRLLGRLGTGGMGQVYLAKSPGGRLVAIKLIRAELAEERGFRARFASEIAAARNVSGMYTAAVIDSDTDAEPPWMATAYVAGPSLADAVADDGPLPVKSVLALAAGLAEALGAIHRAGVVHRDLKPSNVLLATDGPRVIDFGISRAIERSMLTTTGVVMGSPGFMSPEQARGQREIGPPTDVFSLGAVLAYAASGEGPFGAGPTPALLYRVVNESPDLAQVPARLRVLIQRCLAKEPADRPTPAELLVLLSPEVGVLTGEWLPRAVSDTFDRYSPTVVALTPPPPSRPEPATPMAESESESESAEAEPAEAEPAEVASAEVASAEPEPAPVAIEPEAVAFDLAAEPGSPEDAAESVPATEATDPDDSADATRDIVLSAGLTAPVGAKAVAPPTALIRSGEAESALPDPAVTAALGAAAGSAAAVAGSAGAPHAAAVVPSPTVLPESPAETSPAPPHSPAAPGSGGSSPAKPPAGNVSPLRRWRWPVAAAAAVIVAAVAITLALLPGGTAKPTSGPTPSLARVTTSPAATHTTASSTPTTPTKSPTKKPTKQPSKKPTKKPATARTHAPTPTAGSTPSPNPVVTTSSSPPTVTSSPPSTHPVATKTTTKATGPQTITGVSGASSQGCSAYGSIGSASGGSSVGYSFVNNSGESIQVWYLTPSGSGQLVGTVSAGSSYGPGVKTGQDWMVANSGGGCLGIFTITGGGGITVG